MIKKKSEVDFESEDCLYLEKDCFEFKDRVYEDLRNDDSFEHDFRVLIEECDYDYVEDEKLIKELKRARDQRSPVCEPILLNDERLKRKVELIHLKLREDTKEAMNGR